MQQLLIGIKSKIIKSYLPEIVKNRQFQLKAQLAQVPILGYIGG